MRSPLFFILMLLLVAAPGGAAEPPADPAAIRAEMMKIRRATNWNDPKAVKEANERVRQLTAQLETLRLEKEGIKAGATATEAAEAARTSTINRATVMEKVERSVLENQGAVLELNTELRRRIVGEYEEERDAKITGQPFLEELTTLVVNIETREGQAALKQLDQFVSVRRLIITGGKAGAPINLDEVLTKAGHLPLQELQIINFRTFVTSIPASIGRFKALTTLVLVNNALSNLPAAVGSLPALTTLLVDVNPIDSILPWVERLAGLRQLGIAKTRVGAEEVARIRTILPACEVTTP